MLFKRINRIIQVVLLVKFCLLTTGLSISGQSDVQYQIGSKLLADMLGWKVVPGNICGGYYIQPNIPYRANPKVFDQKDNYNIEADKVSWLINQHRGTLLGHVKLIQQDREVTADSATTRANPKTHKLRFIDAFGHIHFISANVFAIASKAHFDLLYKTVVLDNICYRVQANQSLLKRGVNSDHKGGQQHTKGGVFYGCAKQISQIKPKVYHFHGASYTSCAPTSNAWYIKGRDMTLNYLTGAGVIKDAKLYIKGIPVFYLPYFHFPINKWRKSGLLTPSYRYDQNNGLEINLPFYLNLAPNYDDIITPSWKSRRGMMLDNQFNYLSQTSQGKIVASFLPDDRLFEKYKKTQAAVYGDDPDFTERLQRLEDASNNRYALSWQNDSQFNNHWRSHIDYTRVSDDNYQEDFTTNNALDNQLLQQLSINYLNNSWTVAALLQRYQTLHPIDQVGITNQYEKLPEFNLILSPSNPLAKFFYPHIQGIYTHFDIKPTPDNNTRFVTGNRFVLLPSLNLPINRDYGSITSHVKLYLLGYLSKRPNQEGPKDVGRVVPSFDADAKLIFMRHISLFGNSLKQTLEPEIYYLYVPYVNQDALPIFDAASKTFSYNNMFTDNRFSGYDRVGDANQVTIGLKSRFIDTLTGQPKMSVSVATIYYFRNRRVCVAYDCSHISDIDKQRVSPIASQVSYHLSQHLNFNSQLTWNPIDQRIATQSIMLSYHSVNKSLFNLGYYSVNNSQQSGVAPSLEAPINSSNFQDIQEGIFSFHLPLNQRWRILGSWNYNWGHILTDNDDNNALKTDSYSTYTYGLEYNSCCFAWRLVGYHLFKGLNNNLDPLYNKGVYLQISLKGLGKIGSSASAMSNLLQNQIQGYTDTFS